jgi:hypothetical protein
MNRVIQPKVKVTSVQGEIFNVTIGRAAWEASSAMWNLGTNSAFALGPPPSRKIHFNIYICILIYKTYKYLRRYKEEHGEQEAKGRTNSKLYYDQRSVGQAVLLPGTNLGPTTNFFLPSLIIF